MTRFVRNSVLRARGERPAAVLALRTRLRKATGTISAVRDVVTAVNTPNGTTRKVARLVAA